MIGLFLLLQLFFFIYLVLYLFPRKEQFFIFFSNSTFFQLFMEVLQKIYAIKIFCSHDKTTDSANIIRAILRFFRTLWLISSVPLRKRRHLVWSLDIQFIVWYIIRGYFSMGARVTMTPAKFHRDAFGTHKFWCLFPHGNYEIFWVITCWQPCS